VLFDTDTRRRDETSSRVLLETSVRCAEGIFVNVLWAILHRRREVLLSVDVVILHRFRWMPVLGEVEVEKLELDLDLELGPGSGASSMLFLMVLFLAIVTDFIEHRVMESVWSRFERVEWIISEREREGEEFGKVDEMIVLCLPILSLFFFFYCFS
jgi:hypothetical protein